jgi:hypothetical protein
MSGKLSRGIGRLSVLLLIVAVILASSLAAFLITRPTCTSPISNSTSAYTTDCNIGVTLGLSANPSIRLGANLTIRISVLNALDASNRVMYTHFPTLPLGPDFGGSTWYNYVLPVPPSCGNVPSGYVPYFVVIYNQSKIQQLNNVAPSTIICVSSGNQNYHQFSPSQTINESFTVGGSWKSTDLNEPWINATYSQFTPGNYTIVALDPWNQSAKMNFTVGK